MEEEHWKDIEGYEGLYEVSDQGRVRSLNYHHTGRVQLLKPQMNTWGYLHVVLCKDGKRKFCRLHRLVAQAFLVNPLGLPELNHIDENKQNNCVDNLEWCSAKENSNHGTRNARIAAAKNKPVEQRTKDGRLLTTWPSLMEAWRQTGIDYANISNCCNGKLRSTGGYVWRYAE